MKNVADCVSTKGLDGPKALSFWEDHLSSIGVKGKVSPSDSIPFFANADICEFGKGRLYHCRISSSSYARSQADCSSNPSDFFSLLYVNKGKLFVDQNQCSSVIREGDCCMTYSAEPRYYGFHSGIEGFSLLLPRTFIQQWLFAPFDCVAKSFSEMSPFGMALAATLAAVALSSLKGISVPHHTVVEQICSLLALSAGPPKINATSYREALFHRLRQTLRAHCCEKGFNQSSLAEQHRLSTRTIQMTFSAAGTSFEREMMNLRMGKARLFLDDSRYDKKSISEIAGFLGYRHPSHFITHFRNAFGHSPAAYREIRKA